MTDQTVTVKLESGQTVTATPEHPFYAKGQGWKPAGMLTKGDVLTGGDPVDHRVVDVRSSYAPQPVYDLVVDRDHTYFVVAGPDHVWVHNGYRAAGDRLPIEGGPVDGELVSEPEPGEGTIRTYDSNGRAKADYDFGHDYEGKGDPHKHRWIWKGPLKGRGNPLRGPAELWDITD